MTARRYHWRSDPSQPSGRAACSCLIGQDHLEPAGTSTVLASVPVAAGTVRPLAPDEALSDHLGAVEDARRLGFPVWVAVGLPAGDRRAGLAAKSSMSPLGPNLHYRAGVDARGPFREACSCQIGTEHPIETVEVA